MKTHLSQRGRFAASSDNSQLCYKGSESNQVPAHSTPAWFPSYPLPSERFPNSNRKPQGGPQAAPKPKAHSAEHQPPSMDSHPLPKGGSLLSTRASCFQPKAAGALLSTKVPKQHAPCFYPQFNFPQCWINLEAKLLFSSQLKDIPSAPSPP